MLEDTPTLERVVTGIVIIGAGFSGLGLASVLKREGQQDFLILERADNVGGTWRDNTYPGAACDIQSHLYSYSFRPNPNWSRVYAPQPEILAYLQATAREEELIPHIRFGQTVCKVHWDASTDHWEIETEDRLYRARALVSAAGHLSDPSYPDLPGLADFHGDLFHSARWNHQAVLDGARIGIIGTGASAIQIVPELADRAALLTVFQRTAPYIVPRRDRCYSTAEKGMFARQPQTMQTLRDELFWGNESRFPQRRRVSSFISQVRQIARAHLEDQIADPALRDKLTPSYQIGCKRILVSNDYYPTFARTNVSLETSGIAKIGAEGVTMQDGRHVGLDVLIVATGFEATDLPIAEVIHGKNGETLAAHWRDGSNAYACTAVHGFPNFFLMLGPNTGLGAGSMIYMAETQIAYIRGALEHIIARDTVIEPNASDQQAYVESLHARAEGSVWTEGGCSSWYLHPKSGKITALWPDFMSQFRRENGTFRMDGYRERAALRESVSL